MYLRTLRLEKEINVLEKCLEKVLNILDPKICTNPAGIWQKELALLILVRPCSVAFHFQYCCQRNLRSKINGTIN